MKKIIRLTESDLTRIIKRIIQEKKSLVNESATIGGVKIETSNGGLATSISGDVNKYTISVNCGKEVFGAFVSVYTGPIKLSSIWDKDGGIGGKDNTGKLFSISQSKAANLVKQMKDGKTIINSEGEGTISGITGKCYVTLKKK